MGLLPLGLCQTHWKQVPVFSRLMLNKCSIPPVHTSGSICVVFPVCSPFVPKKDRSPSRGHFLGSLVFQITLEIGQNHLSIEAQCDHHTSIYQRDLQIKMLYFFSEMLGLAYLTYVFTVHYLRGPSCQISTVTRSKKLGPTFQK